MIVLRKVCAWCVGAEVVTELFQRTPGEQVTHTICPSCERKLLGETIDLPVSQS